MKNNNNHNPDHGRADEKLTAAADPVAATLSRLSPKMIRDDPEGARELLDRLSLEDRVRVLMRFHGKERMELIHLSADAPGLVQALPAAELWITIKEAGEEDSISLIQMAAPAQLQHMADLEWWYQDSLDPLSVAYWFMLMYEAGPEVVVNWFRQADDELLALAFSSFFQVYKADPDDQGNEPWRAFKNLWTLDDLYYLHFSDPNLAPTIERVLSAIRGEEPMRYYGLLDLVDLGFRAELEEEAGRFRMARLADYGFVEPEEALEIYSPISDPDLAKMEEQAPEPKEKWFTERPLPASEYPLSLQEPPPLLGRALSLVRDLEAIEDVRLGFGSLVNRVLIADDMDLSKLENLCLALAKTHAFVEMGLLRWSKGDPERAAHLLRTQHLISVFRAGYTRVLNLGRKAQRLKREGWLKQVAFGTELLGEDGAVMEGLLRIRPQYYGGADDKGAPVYREFLGEPEVQRAEGALLRTRLMGRIFFDALKVSGEELALLKEHYQGPGLTWETVFLTGVGQAFCGTGFRFSPLLLDDARTALSNMLTPEPPRRLREDVREEVQKRMEDALARISGVSEGELALSREFVNKSLQRLEEEARELELEKLEARYFPAMVITD